MWYVPSNIIVFKNKILETEYLGFISILFFLIVIDRTSHFTSLYFSFFISKGRMTVDTCLWALWGLNE